MNIFIAANQKPQNLHLKKNNAPNFGRALTTAETKLIDKYNKQGRKKAEIEIFAINLPVAATFSKTGIGNFSGVVNFAEKIKPLTGMTATLFLPLGEAYDKHHSPFSTGGFGLYKGYFDPDKLATKEYGNLLNLKDKTLIVATSSSGNETKTEYDKDKKIDEVLDKAYEKYKKGNKKLKSEFEKYLKKPTTKYFITTYAKEKDPQKPERYKFKQFLLKKQYNKMRNELKKNDIDIIIDIPVGTDRDLDKKLEKEDPFLFTESGQYRELGTHNENGEWVGWGITPLDPRKKSAQELVYWKTRYHAEFGDGVRLDAFQGNMFASDGNGILPEYQNNPKVLADQLFYGLKDGGTNPNKSFAEHLPMTPSYDKHFVDSHLANKSAKILGQSIPKLTVTRWDDFGPNSFYSCGSHEIPGCHQDENGNKIYDKEKIKNNFIKVLGGQSKKAFLPFTDILGIAKTYNVPNTCQNSNWSIKLPESASRLCSVRIF